MSEEKLLRVDQVAEMLDVSNMTIYRELKRGNLRHLRVGSLYRIPESAVKEYLQKGAWVPE